MNRKQKSKIVCLLAFFCLSAYYVFPEKTNLKLGISFPPMKNKKQREFTLEHLKSLNVSLVRYSAHWKLREPSQGRFYWKPLDERVNFTLKNKISLLLTIPSDGPAWACGEVANDRSCVFKDKQEFRSYIRALLNRYSNRIDKIQFGNEWDSIFWYAGSHKDYVEFNNILYEETKKYSPQTKVVLGGITKSVFMYIAFCKNKQEMVLPEEKYLTQGRTQHGIKQHLLQRCPRGASLEERVNYVLENAKYDIVDLHLYDDPENWPTYLQILTALTDKPIIVSEFGCPNPSWEKYTQKYHAQRLKTCLQTLSRLPIEEAYHYTLVDSRGELSYHINNGLIDNDLKTKKAYSVFKDFSAEIKNQEY